MLRNRIYIIQVLEAIILVLDSTLLNTYGKQEGKVFNFHCRSNRYHPLVCYDGITDDLIKFQLRNGTLYSSTGVVDFLQLILDKYQNDYSQIKLLLRGDSSFTTPALYKHSQDKYTVGIATINEH